jgi:predicted anti-sigma-YlaC factor YlaD
VRCETFREALSARLDGEEEPLEPGVVDRHLTTCAPCRTWYARAGTLRRLLTVRAAPPVPDLTEVVLDRIPAPTGERWGARVALGLAAIGQLALAMAQLLGVATGMDARSGVAMLGHLSHESTAWNLAVGAGLFWAAVRPRSAAGQLPVLTGFVVVLTGLSLADLARHDVTAGRLVSHVFVLAGLVLLFVVVRQHRDGGGRPRIGDALNPGTDTGDGTEISCPANETRPKQRRWQRPARRRHAA